MRNYKNKSLSTAVFSPLVIARGFSPAAIRFSPPPSLRSRVTAVAIRFSFKGNTESFTLRVQNDRSFSSLRCECPVDTSAKQKHRPSRQARPPSGVRQFVLSPLVITKPCKRLWESVSLSRGIRILSRFAFRMTGLFRHCGAGVRWTPLRSRSTDRAGRRDRR